METTLSTYIKRSTNSLLNLKMLCEGTALSRYQVRRLWARKHYAAIDALVMGVAFDRIGAKRAQLKLDMLEQQ